MAVELLTRERTSADWSRGGASSRLVVAGDAPPAPAARWQAPKFDRAGIEAQLHTVDDGRRMLGQVTEILKDAYALKSRYSRLADERGAFTSRVDQVNRYAGRLYKELPAAGQISAKKKAQISTAAAQAYGVLLDGAKHDGAGFGALEQRALELSQHVTHEVRAVASEVRDASERVGEALWHKARPWVLGAAAAVAGGYLFTVVVPILFAHSMRRSST